MSAIRIAKALRIIIVLRKEERGIRAVDSVLIKKTIYRTKEDFGICQGKGRLAPHVRLQICHQQRRGNALAGNVADDKADVLLAEIEEVEIVAANLASLQAETRIFEGFDVRLNLRKQAGLDLLSDFNFLSAATFGLKSLG